MDYLIINLLLVGSVFISLYAQAKVSSSHAKFSKIAAKSGLSGAETAERLLHAAGIYDVEIVHISGRLTDNYNSATKTLSLSDSVYGLRSIAAISIAAHECGHAMQHNESYGPLVLRHSIYPVANFGSRLSFVFIFAGVFFGYSQFLIKTGIILFSLAVIFQLVTLPVEFDASRRAIKHMNEVGILCEDENPGAKKMLSAAALTYVASALTAVLQLLRLISIYGGKRRD